MLKHPGMVGGSKCAPKIFKWSAFWPWSTQGEIRATAVAAQLNFQGMPALRFIGLGGKIAATRVGLVPVEALLKQLAALTVAAIQ